MINDSERAPETLVKHWQHLIAAFIVFLPNAIYVLFIAWFMNSGPEKVMLWTIVAVCLIALIVIAAFTSLYGLAYVAAVAPLPLVYLMAAILSGPITRKWTEDVLLDDGSVIQVKRMVKFKESNSLSGDSYNAVETDASISFTGKLKDLPLWRVPLMPLVLYKNKEINEWVVVATTTSSDVLRRNGNPCPAYWEYHLDKEGWRKSTLSDSSIGRPANLLISYRAKINTKHVTVSNRLQRESGGRSFEAMNTVEKSYRVILSKNDAGCRS